MVVGDQCSVTLSATEGGKTKGDDGSTGFTTAAFSLDGMTPVSGTSLTVASGAKITVLGAVWLSGMVGDHLDSVTVGVRPRTSRRGRLRIVLK